MPTNSETCPTNPLDPLATSPAFARILLSESASKALTESGEHAFTIIHRSMRTEEPDTAGRWVIHLCPITWRTAQDAANVLLGRATARKIKT